MDSSKQGYVYILTNPSFKDDWVKIGKSMREVNVRSKELDNTSIPLPFNIFATLKTAKYNEIEKLIHQLIDTVAPDIRIRKGREFFNITPLKAYELLKSCSEQDNDSELVVHDEELLLELKVLEHGRKNQASRPRTSMDRLTFDMIGIPVGAELNFTQQKEIQVTVVDKTNTVRIDDLEISLSAAVRYIKEKLGTLNPSGSYQGGMYFEYNGEKLTDIRKRLGR